MNADIRLVEHWPDDEWRERWLSRFAIPSSQDQDLVNELATRLEPFLVFENQTPAEWIDFVPTSSSEWELIPTLDAMSARRWNSIRAMAKQLGEERIFISPVDSQIKRPGIEAMAQYSYLVSTALAYEQFEESADFDAINIVWSNEVPYMIVGESGAWAFWTLAGSRADVSVLSFDADRVRPKVKSDFSAFRLNAGEVNDREAQADIWWKRAFSRRSRKLPTFMVIPVQDKSAAVQVVSRKVLNFFKPTEGYFEADFPWSAHDTWPREVAAAAERLCGKDPDHALSGVRELTTATEQDWHDFVTIAPHAYDATVFDESSGEMVSLIDGSESISVSLARYRLKELRRVLRGRAMFHRI